jgi:ribonuclease R
VVHRVLRALLRRRATQARKEDWARRFPKMALHVSERERAAENAERELTKYYQCLWALRHRGEVYTGTVSGVTSFGVFVSLPNGVEGMVRLGALRDDQYHYHEDLLALEGLRSKRRIRIGDEMEVKIEGADPSARQIDLTPTEGFFDQAKAERKKKAPPRKVAATEPKGPPPHAKARPRRVVGPPEERRGFTKPVKVKVQKIYFGAWGAEAPTEPAPAKKKRRRRRRKA